MTPDDGRPRALAADLKVILACPHCKRELEIREAHAQIRCLASRLAFPIDDGIPVMLLDEARAF